MHECSTWSTVGFCLQRELWWTPAKVMRLICCAASWKLISSSALLKLQVWFSGVALKNRPCPSHWLYHCCPEMRHPSVFVVWNNASFRIIICWDWCFLTLVCLSCQSWISLLGRSILQSWYLFWAHHCVVSVCDVALSKNNSCIVYPRGLVGVERIWFGSWSFLPVGQTDLWSEDSLAWVACSLMQGSGSEAVLLKACSEGFIRTVLLFWLCLGVLPRVHRLRCVNCFFSAGPSFTIGLFLLRKAISLTQSRRKRTLMPIFSNFLSGGSAPFFSS